MQLHRCERGPFELLCPVQAVAIAVRDRADGELRGGLGLVLLDLENGKRGAVELQRWSGGGDLAAEDLGEELELHEWGAGLCVDGIAGVLLRGQERTRLAKRLRSLPSNDNEIDCP